MRTMKNVLAAALIGSAAGLFCLPGAALESDAADGENLVAFIGQKIRLDAQKQEEPRLKDPVVILLDAHFVASYRILEVVYGNYRGSTIDFGVYDHYGVPAFSRYETVLLFVSRQPDGNWLHEKYLYVDLHKGTDDQWYGCGDPYRGAPHPGGSVRARLVQFMQPVSYPLQDLSSKQIAHAYPAGYFELRNGRAYCLLGTPVAELFEATKETVLKARGIFK